MHPAWDLDPAGRGTTPATRHSPGVKPTRQREQCACVVSSADHSFAALRATGECVIAIPAVEMAQQVVGIGNCSGRDVDKFAAFSVTPRDGRAVAAPLIEECFANLECRVVDTQLVQKFNLFVLEVVQAWTDPQQAAPKTIHHHGYGNFIVDGAALSIESKMP